MLEDDMLDTLAVIDSHNPHGPSRLSHLYGGG